MGKKLTSVDLIKLIYNGVRNNSLNRVDWDCDYCNKQITHFHASSVGDCIRKLYYDVVNKGRLKEFSQQEYTFLRDGHINENIIREGLKGSGVNILKRFNMEKKHGKALIVMHSDFVIEWEGVKYIIEQKSVKDTTWKEITKTHIVPERYKDQIQCYFDYETDIDYGFILIKRRQTSDILPFPENRDKKRIKLISTKLNSVLTYAEKEEAPERPYASRKYIECMQCVYADNCWSK